MPPVKKRSAAMRQQVRYSPYTTGKANRAALVKRKPKPAATKTVRTKRRRTRTTMRTSSKSIAFLRTGRIGRKYKKRTGLIYNGVTRVIETSTNVQDAECVYVGHSVPVFQMKYCAWWALLKTMYTKAGGSVQNFQDSNLLTSCGSVVGDIIRVNYKGTADAAIASLDQTVAAGTTVENLVLNFANQVLLDSKGVQFINAEYLPLLTPTPVGRMGYTTIRLEGAYVDFYMKMDLKMQNRSKFANEFNQEDDINNVAIYGKSYFGPGTGTRLKSATSTASFASNVNSGLILQGASSFGTALSEPLDYQYFANVSKIGKVHMDAGHLKTSQIVKSCRVNFGNLMSIINPQLNDANNYLLAGDTAYFPAKVSSYRMFAMEKMMDANPSATPTNVQIALEHNVRISARFQWTTQNSTNISFKKERV